MKTGSSAQKPVSVCNILLFRSWAKNLSDTMLSATLNALTVTYSTKLISFKKKRHLYMKQNNKLKLSTDIHQVKMYLHHSLFFSLVFFCFCFLMESRLARFGILHCSAGFFAFKNQQKLRRKPREHLFIHVAGSSTLHFHLAVVLLQCLPIVLYNKPKHPPHFLSHTHTHTKRHIHVYFFN